MARGVDTRKKRTAPARITVTAHQEALRQQRDQLLRGLHPAFQVCQKLMDAKARDYSGGGVQNPARTDYHPYGDVSYLQMLHTKWTRVENLTREKISKGDLHAVNFESLQDSVRDLINYAAFFWAFLEAGGNPNNVAEVEAWWAEVMMTKEHADDD